MTLTELAFPAMGTSVRLLASPGAPLHRARCLIEDLEARLTRFDPHSELCALNADPRETVPASRALRDAVRAAIAGAAATGGLADPTLLGAVVRAGYDRSLVGHPRADLRRGAGGRPRAAAGRALTARPTGGACTSTTRPAPSSGRPASSSTSAAAPRAWPPTSPSSCSRRTARAPPTSAATCACTACTRCSSPTR